MKTVLRHVTNGDSHPLQVVVYSRYSLSTFIGVIILNAWIQW